MTGRMADTIAKLKAELANADERIRLRDKRIAELIQDVELRGIELGRQDANVATMRADIAKRDLRIEAFENRIRALESELKRAEDSEAGARYQVSNLESRLADREEQLMSGTTIRIENSTVYVDRKGAA